MTFELHQNNSGHLIHMGHMPSMTSLNITLFETAYLQAKRHIHSHTSTHRFPILLARYQHYVRSLPIFKNFKILKVPISFTPLCEEPEVAYYFVNASIVVSTLIF